LPKKHGNKEPNNDQANLPGAAGQRMTSKSSPAHHEPSQPVVQAEFTAERRFFARWTVSEMTGWNQYRKGRVVKQEPPAWKYTWQGVLYSDLKRSS
jgi:hypothetical protein